MSNTFTIDGHEFDLASPMIQKDLLVGRAIAHIIRNEAASSVRTQLVSDARDAKRKSANDPKVDLTDDERKAIRFNAEDPAHKALYVAAQTKKANDVREGKIGESSGVGAPRKTDFERRVEAMCRKAVVSTVQAKLKLWVGEKKMPKADQHFKWKQNGQPIDRTFGEMVDSYYKTNKATVDKAVQKQLDDEARAAERAAKSEGEGLDF